MIYELRVLRNICIVLLLAVASPAAFPQAETVPVSDPVYRFLKRMEVKGLVAGYHDAVLPLSRGEVAGLLTAVTPHRDKLSTADRGRLEDFLAEFEYDISGSLKDFEAVIAPSGEAAASVPTGLLGDRERVLYLHADSTVSLFFNGLLDADTRSISGDALGSAHSTYLQVGFRARGTALGRLGYTLQFTNAQFWGSRELLGRDPIISQSHALRVDNIQNFDFAEGSLRYDAGIVSAQVGRERVLWGSGFEQKMILSENARMFDFIRFDAGYKAVRYSFIHGWLLGQESLLRFSLPADTAAVFYEPVIADKFFSAHRIEISFPGLFDIGGQEMVVYSNRSVDLAYLTPLSLLESVQRSRGERDNVYWAFDIQTHFMRDLQLSATILYDDIHVPDMFSNRWTDRYAWQAGLWYADPFTLPNTNLIAEYTRVEPYVYSHSRSRDNSYTSYGMLLGANVPPNGDGWTIRVDHTPLRNLRLSARVLLMRHGMNETDASGTVVRNVGGDVEFPHRDTDSRYKKFLDGVLRKRQEFELRAVWEALNQLWVTAAYQVEKAETPATGDREQNMLLWLHMALEF